MPARHLYPVPCLVPVTLVTIEWDAAPGLHLARCGACAAHFRSSRLGEVEAWADRHHCDPEMIALLAETDLRRAA
ncbi:hypothetical protein [Actinomadura rupiterrae]|uniref:hypothetical protein n=1 Tax=Actinomadura rupiterrae TaxID=559627 RepID=UPI0020A25E65|nr:hypothetical protein [Actinomadura rupiterrae]MCP2340402.1 hypothetical protein [Actinomadura rupiterrae]